MPVYNANIEKRGPNKGKLKPPHRRRIKNWQCHWFDSNAGKFRDSFFATKTEADNFDLDKRSQNKAGTYLDDDKGKTLLSVYILEWLALQKLRPSTMASYKSMINKHIIPHLGHLPLKAIRRSHIKSWVGTMREIAAPSSVRSRYTVLSSALKDAVHDRAIPFTPCIKIDMPDDTDTSKWLPNVEQVAALIENIPDRLKLAVYLAAGCGLRLGEILGLVVEKDRQRSGIDFLGRKVRVRHQLRRAAGRGFYLGPPKTKKSTREVDLPDNVAAAASEHIRLGYTGTRTMVDEVAKARGGQAVERDVKLLFVREDGKPWSGDDWSAAWSAAIKATEQLADAPGDFTVHWLRHYFVSLMIEAGASVKEVQVAVGHTNPAITLTVYTHLFPTSEGKACSVIDAAFARGREELGRAS